MLLRDELILDIPQGEDWVGQIYWTDEDGNPIIVADYDVTYVPEQARGEARDADGNLILQFSSKNMVGAGSTPTKPAIYVTGSQGLLQLVLPKAWTTTTVVGSPSATPIPMGRYLFDLFAVVGAGLDPYVHGQMQQVVTGWIEITARTTKMEVTSL